MEINGITNLICFVFTRNIFGFSEDIENEWKQWNKSRETSIDYTKISWMKVWLSKCLSTAIEEIKSRMVVNLSLSHLSDAIIHLYRILIIAHRQ